MIGEYEFERIEGNDHGPNEDALLVASDWRDRVKPQKACVRVLH
jgi:hypothetical protein